MGITRCVRLFLKLVVELRTGKEIKAVQTGGPSGGCLTEKDLDTPIDFEQSC